MRDIDYLEKNGLLGEFLGTLNSADRDQVIKAGLDTFGFEKEISKFVEEEKAGED